jgi:hypothetical protein
MKAVRRHTTYLLPWVLWLGGCSAVPAHVQRAGWTALGAGAGGAVAYGASDRNPLATLGGAAIGAAGTQVVLGPDRRTREEGFDDGYIQGQSDAIKRQYFLRQAAEAEPIRTENEGQVAYYVVPGPEVTVDGRKLEPHHVTVRVVE